MTKEYLCKNTINEVICGEKNPEKFIKGRYGICKKCRSKMVSEQNQQRKYIDIIEKVKKIDLKDDIQIIFDYNVKYNKYEMESSILDSIYELNKENKKIVESIKYISIDKNILFENFDKLDKFQKLMANAFNIMKTKIEELDSELSQFKKDIDINSIKNRLKELENFKRDILDEKIQKEINS